MDTSAGYYQAPRPPRVPLDEVLIKLHPEGFNEAFDADGINVGSGGISMRASVLPQVGSSLRCHLDNPAGDEAIEMIGRVVWAHDSGEHAGEFGIRFTHLSSDDQLRIEALIQRWGRASASAPTVRLQLGGVDSSIMAEIHTERDDSLTVEQPLPFLEIGSPVRNENSGRRGHLEAVELRMDAETPRLVLSIGYEDLSPERESGVEDAAAIRSPMSLRWCAQAAPWRNGLTTPRASFATTTKRSSRRPRASPSDCAPMPSLASDQIASTVSGAKSRSRRGWCRAPVQGPRVGCFAPPIHRRTPCPPRRGQAAPPAGSSKRGCPSPSQEHPSKRSALPAPRRDGGWHRERRVGHLPMGCRRVGAGST